MFRKALNSVVDHRIYRKLGRVHPEYNIFRRQIDFN